MAGRGDTPQLGDDGGGHGAEVPLPGEHPAEGVAHVDALHVAGGGAGVVERALDHLLHQVVHALALAGEVACEVGLVTAKDPDAGLAAHVVPIRAFDGWTQN